MKNLNNRLPVILVICLVIPSVNSFAGVWEDKFEDGNADGWIEVSGDWEVNAGVYEQTTMDAVYQKSILELDNLTDLTLDVDITILDSSAASTSIAAGVLVRTDEEGTSGYRIWGRPDQHGFQFSVWQDNTFQHVITDAAFKAIEGETYHLKVKIEGFTISAWFNDELLVDEYEDADKLFASGYIGLINYNSHCQYDNLIIEGVDVTSNLAVTPAGKLTIAWGKVKKMK
jgi:hypothetical protein